MIEMKGELIAALKMVPEREIDGMFDHIISEKALSIENCTTIEELWQLKGAVKELRSVKNFFKTERARK